MLVFYPHIDEPLKGTLKERIDILLEAAEAYKAAVLGNNGGSNEIDTSLSKRIIAEVPRDQRASYHWDAIASVLNEIKALPELSRQEKINKADAMTQLAEVYEVLRAAKMPKLEAVRHALSNEAKELHRQAG